jgi:hypothetical protein
MKHLTLNYNFIYCCFLGCMQDTSCLGTVYRGVILMELILPLSSLIHCHIIKSAHMTAYLMSINPTETGQSQCIYHELNYLEWHII